jgi:hypothetical protein
MRMPPQTRSGVTYTPITGANKKASITMNVTVHDVTAHYEGGICIFLGTTQVGSMTGSVTVEGFKGAEGIGITAT